jgi:BA14K-like protein
MHFPRIIGATAALTLLVSPAIAQEVGGAIGPGPQGPGYYGYGYYPAYPADEFWPGRVAGDVVSGAVGTAGAIASAPFRALSRNDAYAMAPDASSCSRHHRSYDPSSGTYLGHDGRRHPC